MRALAESCRLIFARTGCHGRVGHFFSRMKQSFLLWVLVMLNCASNAASPREADWRKVEEAMQKGLPRSAIEAIEPIIQGALADQAWAEATKAIARKIALQGEIQGNRPEEKIVRMEAALATAPEEIRPLLTTILANWYWQYFQANRWRFMQRTTTATPSGDDFTTWDLKRLFAHVDELFQRALADEARLKQLRIEDFDELLVKGTLPDKYRPTLYDFIAHQALEFYTTGEQAGARPEDAFELPSTSPVLDGAEAFMAWDPGQAATNSAVGRALGLYQELLRFHTRDEDPTAFADVDLERLRFGYNTAFGPEKEGRYRSALQQFADRWADHEVSAVALERRARLLQEQGDLVEAHRVATRGKNAHPSSPGGQLCTNLLSEIEAKSSQIQTEEVWNLSQADAGTAEPSGARPVIEVRYRNLDKVYFKLREARWEDSLRQDAPMPQRFRPERRRSWLAEPALRSWSHDLPPSTDYRERTVEFPAPTGLKPGFYHLVSSHRPDFREEDNQIGLVDFWVSDLALVTRSRDGRIEGFVLNANSGEPLAEASVELWKADQRGAWARAKTTQSDTLGTFAFDLGDSPGDNGNAWNVRLRARHGEQQVSSSDRLWAQTSRSTGDRTERTFLFTDRALYRPGQSIQYKGICVRWATGHGTNDNYELLPGREVTVVLRDNSEREVGRQQHRCSDYGSFSGTFTAPRGGVTGRMVIMVEGQPEGSTWLSMEEYKRPKFNVTLEAPEVAPRLNDTVTVEGKAMAYTGAAIDGGQVAWRVVREVRFPPWWGWYRGGRWPRPAASQEIAHGTTTTSSNGGFQVQFTAKPDLAVPETDEPSFEFTVYADVTDSAGETRSDQRSVRVGYTALELSTAAKDWLTSTQDVELRIEGRTLDGKPQAAEGTLKVHALRQPERVQRAGLPGIYGYRARGLAEGSEPKDLSDPNNWELGEVVVEQGFSTDASGVITNRFRLPAGAFRAVLESQDRFGKKVTARQPLLVLDPEASRLPIKVPQLLAMPASSLEPGNEFLMLWGTGYPEGRAFIEIERRHQMVQRYWTEPGRTQQQIRQAVSEAWRGGFQVHVTQVRENRAYLETRFIDVPWTNKELELSWDHFTSKLEPGQKETWTLQVRKRPGAPAADSSSSSAGSAFAELVATLYDASLDQFLPHEWHRAFGIFANDRTTAQSHFSNAEVGLNHYLGRWHQVRLAVVLTYRDFPGDLVQGVFFGRARGRMASMRTGVIGGIGGGASMESEGLVLMDAAAPEEGRALFMLGEPSPARASAALGAEVAVAAKGIPQRESAPPPGPDLSQVSARKNLNETAFFFPQLTSDADGTVRMTFTMPEALTEWRFLGFAHDRQLRSGYLEARTVTAKDIMVQPNPPRFLREGDTIEFTVKVSNQSATRQTGVVKLEFRYASNDQSADEALQLEPVRGSEGQAAPAERSLPFDIPAMESRTFAWRLTVPDGSGFLTYKAVGSTGRLSDGEEGFLPVLSRRTFITESLPLWVRGPGTRQFQFESLKNSSQSDTLRHEAVTVQMVSRPAWYAVLALPYLMEFPHECSEQVFNRLYANALARHIANSDPKIRDVFEQWRNTPALDSPLEKNEELRAVMIEETPWLRQAKNESEARRRVGLLFDANRLDNELGRALGTLLEQQLPDGAWPWFPGGPANDYLTLYIATGFGRLRHLGPDLPAEGVLRAWERLDQWLVERHRRIVEAGTLDENHLGPTEALYLYGRSFFLRDRPLEGAPREVVKYYVAQAKEHWLTLPRQSQGHLALALKRLDEAPTAQAIVRSLRERAVQDEELGMFWRDEELSWWWYRAPIETQAIMIEAFDEVAAAAEDVEALKIWLLKQKQTRDWKTTKATADAVYALLLRGSDLLNGDTLVEVELGGVNVTPVSNSRIEGHPTPSTEPEAGTGFYQRRFSGTEVSPAMGEITVRKTDKGIAWGGVHWQYFEDLAKVKPFEGTPLKLSKALFTKINSATGPVLEAVQGPVKVGDELVVRIELRVDRDMEYVHLKDQRGSGTEPVNVLSQYRFQDGLAYYESTRDTASHFFIDYLPKGTYVFEYSTRVQLRGDYQTGVAGIQCMYAPEFNSHSGSVGLTVR